jgi:plasmid replication initiation protein
MSDLIVTKSNELIESYIFNATELELQILNYAVATLNPHWENQHVVFKIVIPDLVKTFNMKSNKAYELYRDALSRLMDRKYIYYDSNNKRHTENLVIRVSEHIHDKSWLEFKFNSHISKHLSNLKELFTSYNIKHITNFKSRYSFVLYEAFKMNLEKNKAINQNYWTEEINIKKLRENLDLVNKYKVFKDLRLNVLDKAKDEINAYSDILIDFDIKKTGRTPTSIVFKVKRKIDKASDKVKSNKLSKMEQSLSQKEINQRKKLLASMDKEELIKFLEERQQLKEQPLPEKATSKVKIEKEADKPENEEIVQEKEENEIQSEQQEVTQEETSKKEKISFFKRFFI